LYLISAANKGFKDERVAATSKSREANWHKWRAHFQTLGVNAYLQNKSIKQAHTAIFSFAAGVREGVYGTGRIVRAGTVSKALSAVNTKIAMATNTRGVHPKSEHFGMMTYG
jgi:hypothetical protein